jgi:hypothetical protein
MPDKHPNTVRHGGPGASDENAKQPAPEHHDPRPDGTPTNTKHSGKSTGGGERDLNHTHDPKLKN